MHGVACDLYSDINTFGIVTRGAQTEVGALS